MVTDSVGWRAVADNPNAPEALAARQRSLDAAWIPSPPDRLRFIEDRCRDRRVLDLGCAGQATRQNDANWLHRRILNVASSCVGADYDHDEVQRLRAAGFDVVFADVAAGAGELKGLHPFEIVVAGELIEHLSRLDALFSFARSVLDPGGRLILTTPNPFALLRVANGRRGISRDNADHVVLAFPGGIVELAERCGFRLLETTTTDLPDRRTLLKRSLKAELWHLAHPRTPRWPWAVPLLDLLAAWRSWSRGLLGETSLYVLQLEASTVDEQPTLLASGDGE